MSTLAEKLLALREATNHGAAVIYHRVLTVESDISKWEVDHPVLQPLFDMAHTAAIKFLNNFGITEDEVLMTHNHILAMLAAMAAQDRTVQSGSGN